MYAVCGMRAWCVSPCTVCAVCVCACVCVQVPFCGLALLEQLSGHKTQVSDPYLYEVSWTRACVRVCVCVCVCAGMCVYERLCASHRQPKLAGVLSNRVLCVTCTCSQVSGWGYQELQAHQSAVISKAEAVVALMKSKVEEKEKSS